MRELGHIAARRELEAVRAQIKEHMSTDPWNYDGREHLWMRHEDLRSRLRTQEDDAA